MLATFDFQLHCPCTASARLARARLRAPLTALRLSLFTNHYPLFTVLFFLLTIHYSLLTPLAQGQGIGPNSIITTVAGGSWAFRGDGKPAIGAPLGQLLDIAVDGVGNVYAADYENLCVVKIAPSGILTVVAGNGVLGFSGDGGPATSAAFLAPTSLGLDGTGNLYIYEWRGPRIRKVTLDGIISTSISIPIPQPLPALGSRSRIAVDTLGNIYANSRSEIVRFDSAGNWTIVAGNGQTGFSGDGGPATSASLNFIEDIALDSFGNLYIADTLNSRVRKVSPAGIITTVAGNGLHPLASAGVPGDGGPATSAPLGYLRSMAVDRTGNLYILDERANIRRVSSNGIISTVAANVSTGASSLAVDSASNIYFFNGPDKVLYRVEAQGRITAAAGGGGLQVCGRWRPRHQRLNGAAQPGGCRWCRLPLYRG